MKVLFVALFLVAGAFARSAVPQNGILAEGPKCPIDDPLVRPGPININITLPPVVELQQGSTITNLVAEGLSSLRYVINLNALLLTAQFEVTIPTVTGNGTYTASGYVDARPISQGTIPSGNFTGNGLGKVAATGVQLKGSATLFINIISNKVTVRALTLEIVKFDTVAIDLPNFVSAGQPVDWVELSKTLKANFDREFAQYKTELTDKVRLAANNIIEKYTLAELIDLIQNPPGDGEC